MPPSRFLPRPATPRGLGGSTGQSEHFCVEGAHRGKIRLVQLSIPGDKCVLTRATFASPFV